MAINGSNSKRRQRKPLPPPPEFVADDVLLTVREVAAMLRCGISTTWRDARNGRLPRPLYVAPKLPRWRLGDLKAVLNKGRDS